MKRLKTVEEEFYNEMKRLYECVPQQDILIALGDFNAKKEKEDYVRSVVLEVPNHP